MNDNKHDYHVGHKHDHAHEHADKSSQKSMVNRTQSESKKQLNKSHQSDYKLPFFLILTFAIVELFGGVLSQSLALLSDAWHMFSDVLALGLAWLASYLSLKPNVYKNANGQSKIEMFAAMINAILMLAVVGYILFEAVERLKNPQPVSSVTVILIALIGLIVNLVVAKMLHSADVSHTHDHNKHAAYLHVLGDLMGSVAAITAGIVIYFTGWLQIDPILSIFISLLILGFTLKLIKDVWVSFKNG